MAEHQTASALGSSSASLAAIATPPDFSSAPDLDSAKLIEALADRYGLPAEAFRVGAGTVSLLHHVVARAAACGGGETVYSEPSFHLYATLTRDYGLTGRAVPLRDYRHDLPALADAVSEQTRIVLLDSPHNITGTIALLPDVVALAETVPDGAVVVLDNSYGEFQDDDIWFGDLVECGAPVIVCRSFNKPHRLSGLQAGYLVGAPELLDALGPIVLRYDVGTLARAAMASLADYTTVEANRRLVVDARRQLAVVLNDAGIPFVPSESASILINVGAAASQLAYRLTSAGCSLRSPSTSRVPAGHIQLFIDNADTPALLARALADVKEPNQA